MPNLQYLGHSCFLITADKTRILIDPYIKDNPKCAVKIEDLKSVDLILVTHGHSDHLGDAAEIAERYGSKIICIFELANLLGKNTVPMNIGGTISISERIHISMVPARHSSSYKGSYAGEPCGFIVSINGFNIYHAGDTSLSSEMQIIPTLFNIDIALLPIGDVYTMGPEEAVFAAKLLKARKAIPMHYGTFDAINVDPNTFKELGKEQNIDVTILKLGDKIEI
jgi:L-ascorbate metabolism protein UlaG (beta-lactamase superfamily)